jgi:hypothetical protein
MSHTFQITHLTSRNKGITVVVLVFLLLTALLPFSPKMETPKAVLKNKNGVEVWVLSTGATIQRLVLPDRKGDLADVALGFDEVQPYKVK